MATTKKLIEVALPLEAINKESAREKSIRHGHPSTLHLWWARRPLAAARAVIFASLVDDPSSHPDKFPTEEAEAAERERLFSLIEELVKWENVNNEDVLNRAREEILKATNGNPPALLDPFAGGGSIPLEAQRLGLEAHASDLNPVAVMINKAMIEIPPKFAGHAPVNPEARKKLGADRTWKGVTGLAEDVRYYGEWMKQEAFKRIGHLYPKVQVPKEQGGGEATVIAWIWARTVKCPNPACGCEMPLVRSFDLSRKKGMPVFVEPIFTNGVATYHVRHGSGAPDGTVNRKGARCFCCENHVGLQYIREEGRQNRIDKVLIAIVAEGKSGRIYVSPDDKNIECANIDKPNEFPDAQIAFNPRDIKAPTYGLTHFANLFTNRQLMTLTTFCQLVHEVQERIEADAISTGFNDDKNTLNHGGVGAKAYGQAIGVYLAFLVDKLADLGNSLNRWEPIAQCPRQLFNRQAIPMVWDFAEGNPLSKSSGSWTVLLNNLMRSITSGLFNFKRETKGIALQQDAQTFCCANKTMISTDPPYYDNIGYAALSDFFYIWMRMSLRNTYPDIFKTLMVPKTEELVATPYRFDGNAERAKDFFEKGMLDTFQQINMFACDDVPVTIYYAFKQSEADADGSGYQNTVSTGWEAMLSAIINAGFSITGTWPMRTEMSSRAAAQSTNALASSIVLVCRKRPATAPVCTRRDFINTLKRELKPALKDLQQANIAPVDLAQSAIGPGMGVYSRFSKVLEADGSSMSVRSALQIINQELDLYFAEQDGELDADSRFCVDLYSQYAFNDMKFGDADVLARARNTAVERLASLGVLYAQKGVVHLMERADLPAKTHDSEKTLWLLTQQLTRAMETGGVDACAEIVANLFGSGAERAKALAYRLFTIAEQKGWAQEAYAYNSLVIAWPDIQAKVTEMKSVQMVQGTLLN